MAEDARQSWIEAEYERGNDIPLPSYPEEYSGKFNVRIPKSLHRALAKASRREEVSLNQYVLSLLARGDAQYRVERLLEGLTGKVDTMADQLPARVKSIPTTGAFRPGMRAVKDRFAQAA